ncbi:FG-GAP-like repeat-containing protein [Kribbella deserti]|uniref:FG-GAP-like repeat-containing protein n=1 Tax=Kribbella deserti TaxID=1926257 RepID=A0ABV6QN21_9ACTN
MSIAVARGGDGRLLVYGGTDQEFRDSFRWWQSAPGSAIWSSYSGFANPSGGVGSVAAETNGDGRIDLFGTGGDHNQTWIGWQTAPDDDTWSHWSWLNGSGPGLSAAAARNQDGRLDLVGSNGYGHFWINWQTEAGQAWANWTRLTDTGTGVASVAADANADGRLQVVAVDWSGKVYQRRQHNPGGGWSGWTSVDLTTDALRP